MKDELLAAVEWIQGKYALDKRYIASFGHLDDPWVQRVVKSKRRTMKHYASLIKAADELDKISKSIVNDKQERGGE